MLRELFMMLRELFERLIRDRKAKNCRMPGNEIAPNDVTDEMYFLFID